MPWKGQTVEERREEFVRRVLKKEVSKSALCREYGISRPTGDKWLKRYMEGSNLTDRSHAPNHVPNKTDAVTEEAIVRMRKQHPAIGAKKLKRMLENEGIAAPAYSTINSILHRNGLIAKEASIAAKPCMRFEKSRANEMWQLDFKGHFGMEDGKRCHPLTMLDDYSRFCLCLDAWENERLEGVSISLTRAFKKYGLPETLLCDNGNPWGTQQSPGYTRFEVWLMDLGVLTRHGRVMHPQTQGKNERFNGTLFRERLRYRSFEDCQQAQRDFDEYRNFYNMQRPHHALDLETPSIRYSGSSRKLPEKIEAWEYGWVSAMRRVKSYGAIAFRGKEYFLSQSFNGRYVGLLEDNDENGVVLVLYRQFCIAKLDIEQHIVLTKKPFLFDKKL